MTPTSAVIKLGADQEDSNAQAQVRVSQLDSIHVSQLKDQSKHDEVSPDPDYMVVSKKAFEKEMSSKDD